jgi:hypothetical protein
VVLDELGVNLHERVLTNGENLGIGEYFDGVDIEFGYDINVDTLSVKAFTDASFDILGNTIMYVLILELCLHFPCFGVVSLQVENHGRTNSPKVLCYVSEDANHLIYGVV